MLQQLIRNVGFLKRKVIQVYVFRMATSLSTTDILPNELANKPLDLYMKLATTKEWKKRFKIITPMKHNEKKPDNHLRFVCISDTHNETDRMILPQGDVLLHAGDFTRVGSEAEVRHFIDFLDRVRPDFKEIVVIAGNHDLTFDSGNFHSLPVVQMFYKGKTIDLHAVKESLKSKCTYLEDDCTEIAGIKIYGTPWQPEFGGWGFNVNRGADCLEHWKDIPNGIDILMSHGPPLGHGDKCQSGARAGCSELLATVQKRVKPKYHVFGHIHEGYGISSDGVTTYINASSVNISYRQVNEPIIFDLPMKLGNVER